MSRAWRCMAVIASVILGVATPTRGQVTELHGSWIIDGYRFDPGDRSPRGTIAYDRAANTFTGTYVGLKLPAARPELHAWLYDTRSKQAVHLGKVPYQTNTVGKKKAAFQLALPAEPSGSKIQPTLKPAFYLYAALPGANIPQVYCGHGQDFSFTSNQDHTCFD